jgi:hypothetical protein
MLLCITGCSIRLEIVFYDISVDIGSCAITPVSGLDIRGLFSSYIDNRSMTN